MQEQSLASPNRAIFALSRVEEIICESCGFDLAQVHGPQSLIQDLGVDSIDMMDILYGLEKEFKIKFSLAEIENYARHETAPAAFDVENVITPEGLQTLKRLMPDVPDRLFLSGMIVQQIPLLFTAQSIALWVEKKLSQKSA